MTELDIFNVKLLHIENKLGCRKVLKHSQIIIQSILNFGSAFGTFGSDQAKSLSYQAAS